MSIVRCNSCTRQIDTDKDAECAVAPDELMCKACREMATPGSFRRIKQSVKDMRKSVRFVEGFLLSPAVIIGGEAPKWVPAQAWIDAQEQIAALESREVCTVAHENVETCGYCQRDFALNALAVVERRRDTLKARAERAEAALEGMLRSFGTPRGECQLFAVKYAKDALAARLPATVTEES